MENKKFKKIKQIAEKNNLIFDEIEIDEYFNEKVERPTYMVKEKTKIGVRGAYYKYIILDRNLKLFAVGDEQGNYAGGLYGELYPIKLDFEDNSFDDKYFKNFLAELENGK